MGNNNQIYQVDNTYLLKKMKGKGGWTYAEIPEITSNKKIPFGWVSVSGFVDDHVIKKHKLMSMGNGQLFLSLNAGIRKKIKKEAGDMVSVKLYIDDSPTELPEEIIICLENESKEVLDKFMNLSEGEKKTYIDWIYNAKTEDTKAKRIIKMLDSLSRIMQ